MALLLSSLLSYPPSHHFMRKFFAATILAVVLFSPSLHAQEEKTKSSFEFSFVTWKNLTVAPVFYRDGDKYHEIDLIRAQRSELYRFKKPQAQMLLYTQGENEEGEIVYKLAGKTAIKAASSRMLFFIQDHVEVGPDQLPLILSGIDDSLDAFPMGSFRFVNSTKLPLQVLFPSSRKALPPQSAEVLIPKIPELGGFIPIYILDADKNIVFQSRFFGQPRGRKMVFIAPPKKPGGKVNLAFLPQIIPPPADKGSQ